MCAGQYRHYVWAQFAHHSSIPQLEPRVNGGEPANEPLREECAMCRHWLQRAKPPCHVAGGMDAKTERLRLWLQAAVWLFETVLEKKIFDQMVKDCARIWRSLSFHVGACGMDASHGE